MMRSRGVLGAAMAQCADETTRIISDGKIGPAMFPVELVTYDITDPDTYPEGCETPGEVAVSYGFGGGETLVFSARGNYLGQLVKRKPSLGTR